MGEAKLIQGVSEQMLSRRESGIIVPQDYDAMNIDPLQSLKWMAQGRDILQGRMIVGRVPTEHVLVFLQALHDMFGHNHHVEGVGDASEFSDDEEPLFVYLTVEPDLSPEQFEDWKRKQREVAVNMGLVVKTQHEKQAELQAAMNAE